MSAPSHRFACAALLIWVVGVQTLEAVATAGMVLVLLAATQQAWQQRSVWKQGLAGWWPLLLFIGWVIAVPWLGGHTPEGAGLGRLSDWLALPATALLVPLLTPAQRRIVAWTAGVVFLVSCVVALLQYELLWPPEKFFAPLSWTKVPFGRAYERIVGAENHCYGVGLAFHRLKFANTGGFVIVTAFAAALATKGRDRLMAVLVVVAGLGTIWVATQARSASLATLVGLIVMAFTTLQRGRDRVVVLGLLVLLIGGATVASPGMRKRLATAFESTGNGERGLIWSTAVGVVREHPLTGLGLGRYKIADHIRTDAPWDVRWHQGKGHNQFLTFAAETGFPGALVFAWLLAWLTGSFRRRGRALGFGAMAFFVGLACVHDPLFHATVSMATVLVFGVARGLSNESAQSSSETTSMMRAARS